MPRVKRTTPNNKRKTTKTKRCRRMIKFTGYTMNDILNGSYENNNKKTIDFDDNAKYEIFVKKNKREKLKKAAKTALTIGGGLAAVKLGKAFYDKNKDHLKFIADRGNQMYNDGKETYNTKIAPYLDPFLNKITDTIQDVMNSNFVRGYRNYYQDGVNDKLENIQGLLSNNPYKVDIKDLKSIIQNMETQVKDKDEFKVNELKKTIKDIITGCNSYDELTKSLKNGEQTAALGINSLNNMIYTAREQYNKIMH